MAKTGHRTRTTGRRRPQEGPAPAKKGVASAALGGGLAGLGVLLILFCAGRVWRQGRGGASDGSVDGVPRPAPSASASGAHDSRTPMASDSVPESQAFREQRAQGEAHLTAGRFAEAAAAYAQAATAPAPTASRAHMQALADDCRLFEEIARTVVLALEADPKDLYDIELEGTGSTLRARVVEQTEDGVRYAGRDLSGYLKRSEIRRLVPVDGAALVAVRQERLEEARAAAAMEGTALAYYLAAREGLAYGWRCEVAGLFRESAARAREAGITVRRVSEEHQASQLYKTGMYFYSVGMPARMDGKFDEILRDLPRTTVADLVRETRRELTDRGGADIQQLVADSASRTSAPANASAASASAVDVKAADNRQRAEQAFARGAERLKRGTEVSSARESNRLYEEALESLREAAERLQYELEKHPNDKKVEARLQEVMVKLYSALKLKRVNM